MKCPVCGASNIPDDQKKCVQCESDLEAFHMTRKIDVTSKNRLGFGILSSILLVALVFVWIFVGFSGKTADDQMEESSEIETLRLESSLKKMKIENVKLKAENEKLKEQIVSKKVEIPKRTKEYIVENGETLFGIARQIYGNGFRYVDLARDNKLKDPTNIQTGQKLIIYY